MTLTLAVSPMDARSRADRIKAVTGELWELLVAAYEATDWIDLGYSSWSDYCANEFDTDRIKIPRGEERERVMDMLSKAGMSLREIGAATGTSEFTVRKSRSTSARKIADVDLEPPAPPAPKPSKPTPREGISNWSRRVQRVSADCPMSDLTVAEVEELHGAATFLRDYCQGELMRRGERHGRR